MTARRPPRATDHKTSQVSPELPLFEPTGRVVLPSDPEVTLDIGGCRIKLTNLHKVFWPEIGATKRDLLQYYLDVAPVLVPHLRDRAMVMKRYPNGAPGDFFFQKRAPTPRPDCIRTCTIDHGNGNIIDFPMVQDTASLLWVVNLGCIDLNQWYARADDVNTPDYLHFDLDPGEAAFARVRDVGLLLRDALAALGMPTYPKTSGSKGLHVYVPIVRGPDQKRVWTVAKAVAVDLARAHPDLATAEYTRAKRPPGRVLVDYNQNRWGATLASVYSLRPTPRATASAPLTWDEVRGGVEIEDFRIDNLPARAAALGDLWGPVHQDAPGRFDLNARLEM
jgi:bifunctional non-homologous end joining protein LigD